MLLINYFRNQTILFFFVCEMISTNMRALFTYVIVLLSISQICIAQRLDMELSSPNGWRIWLDKHAPWQEDRLILPDELVLSDLPVNIPTCGWTKLYEGIGKE